MRAEHCVSRLAKCTLRTAHRPGPQQDHQHYDNVVPLRHTLEGLKLKHSARQIMRASPCRLAYWLLAEYAYRPSRSRLRCHCAEDPQPFLPSRGYLCDLCVCRLHRDHLKAFLFLLAQRTCVTPCYLSASRLALLGVFSVLPIPAYWQAD